MWIAAQKAEKITPHRTNARGGSRLVTIHGRNTRNQRDSRDCIIQGWTVAAPSHVTADPRYRRGCIHTILRGGLWRQDIKIISKPQWLIYERASEKLRKKTKGKDARRRWRRGEALVKFSACGTAAQSLQPRTSHPARNTSPFHSCLKPSLIYSATDLKDLRRDRVLRRRYITQRYFPSRARNPAVYFIDIETRRIKRFSYGVNEKDRLHSDDNIISSKMIWLSSAEREIERNLGEQKK